MVFVCIYNVHFLLAFTIAIKMIKINDDFNETVKQRKTVCTLSNTPFYYMGFNIDDAQRSSKLQNNLISSFFF